MFSGTYGVSAPEPLSDADAQAVDRMVQATYRHLINKPVPQRFLDLLRSYDEQLQTFQENRDA